MSDLNQLSRRERQIMQILHQRGEASAIPSAAENNDVHSSLAYAPSYSAVRTHLRILEEKGWVTHRKEGVRYFYEPMQSTKKTSRGALADLVKSFFGGSPSEAVAALVDGEGGRISEKEWQRLERLVEEAKSKKQRQGE